MTTHSSARRLAVSLKSTNTIFFQGCMENIVRSGVTVGDSALRYYLISRHHEPQHNHSGVPEPLNKNQKLQKMRQYAEVQGYATYMEYQSLSKHAVREMFEKKRTQRHKTKTTDLRGAATVRAVAAKAAHAPSLVGHSLMYLS